MTSFSLYALTAEAAYANWQDADTPADEVLGNTMLTGAAAALLSRFECPVVATGRVHQPDTLSGFSGTVFKSLNEPSFVFSVKGTLGPTDIAADAMLALTGYAAEQIIDGYIFLKQCATPLGEPLVFSTGERLALGAIVEAVAPAVLLESVTQQLNQRLSSLSEDGTGIFVAASGLGGLVLYSKSSYIYCQ